MARYIDAEQARTFFEEIDAGSRAHTTLLTPYEFAEYLDEIPTADVQEVRHGRWISNDLGGYKWAYYCSECGWIDGYPFNDRHKYCPHCGALMDGK